MGLVTGEWTDRLRGVGAEGRYGFEAIVRYSLSIPTQTELAVWSTSSVAKKLGLAVTVARKALAELAEACLVTRLSRPSGGRGRPEIRYVLAEKMQKVDRQIRQGALQFQEALLTCLFLQSNLILRNIKDPQSTLVSHGAPAILEASKLGPMRRISASNRLLLATLIAHADGFGVVRGLGKSKLSQLTGLSRESIEYRLKRFNRINLIYATLPGLTSSIFASGVVPSIHYLNVGHPLFSAATPRLTTQMVLLGNDSPTVTVQKIVGSTVSALGRQAIAKFLAGQRGEVLQYLQGILLGCATSELNLYGAAACVGPTLAIERITNAIEANLRRPSEWPDGSSVFEEQWNAVIAHFAGMTLDVIVGFADLIPGAGDPNSPFRLLLLPIKQSPSMVVLRAESGS